MRETITARELAQRTHCSACGRKLRLKYVPATLGGNYANPGRASYTGWLNHRAGPPCPRYGLAPDATREEASP